MIHLSHAKHHCTQNGHTRYPLILIFTDYLHVSHCLCNIYFIIELNPTSLQCSFTLACKEVDSITGIFTRAEKTRAASICNKSAITDHVCNENHAIDWANAKVIDRESDKAGRLIREVIWIRKTDNMKRDEGSYQLSHVRDKLLHTDDRRRKSVLMKASDVKPKRR